MALPVPRSSMKAFNTANSVHGEFGCSSLKLKILQRIATLKMRGTRPSGYQLDTANSYSQIQTYSSSFLTLETSISTRIRCCGTQPWFGQHRSWQKTLSLVKYRFSRYSCFTFYSCAITLTGCYVTSKVTGDPFLYLGRGSVGVSEVALLQAAVCPSHSTCSEDGRKLHAGIHEEGTCQLNHCTLAGVGLSFVDGVQEILDTFICQAREREKMQLPC